MTGDWKKGSTALLAVDVGSTNVVAGLFAGERLVAHIRTLTEHIRTAAQVREQLQELLHASEIGQASIAGVAIASVVPAINDRLREELTSILRVPIRFLNAENAPIPLHVNEPETVGADRIANAIAAHTLYGGPVLVIDFGTAVTFDLASESGAFLGGAIAPEMQTAAGALFEKAAQLHGVDFEVPESVVGKTTEDALQSGIVLGFLDMTRGLIARFLADVPQ